METKRLFFGLAVRAPWPDSLPQGRLLDEKDRHVTLVFLGNADYTKVKEALPALPKPPFKVGFVGQFDQCLFLPPRHPRVVAWHVDLLEAKAPLAGYFKTLITWLEERGFSSDIHHPFTPHVTLARHPFNRQKWEREFVPLPLMLHHIHLYESVGHLKYEPMWSYPLLPPFEEISHTADLAFWIRGENYDQLFSHAQVALAQHSPPILPYLTSFTGFKTLDEVIIALNERIATVDQEVGSPLKAVSFHSHLEEKEGVINWEMIVDV